MARLVLTAEALGQLSATLEPLCTLRLFHISGVAVPRLKAPQTHNLTRLPHLPNAQRVGRHRFRPPAWNRAC